jgi:hypothetical protein
MRVRLPHVAVCSSAVLAAAALLIAVEPALAREPGDPIRLQWIEGDLAGFTPILSQDGKQTIGFIEYHQHREGDRLEAVRVARFSDGSSDEDQVEARIGKTLEAVRGRSIIRDTNGVATVDITIDVAKGHIKGFSGLGKDREEYDEKVELPAGTYWGPLIFMVVKNFAQNSTDDRGVSQRRADAKTARLRPRAGPRRQLGRGSAGREAGRREVRHAPHHQLARRSDHPAPRADDRVLRTNGRAARARALRRAAQLRRPGDSTRMTEPAWQRPLEEIEPIAPAFPPELATPRPARVGSLRKDVQARLMVARALEHEPPERFGFSVAAATRLFMVTSVFYRWYFRTQSFGLENLPRGPILLVSNHGRTRCPGTALHRHRLPARRPAATGARMASTD